jgi:hypothetical protein
MTMLTITRITPTDLLAPPSSKLRHAKITKTSRNALIKKKSVLAFIYAEPYQQR